MYSAAENDATHAVAAAMDDDMPAASAEVPAQEAATAMEMTTDNGTSPHPHQPPPPPQQEEEEAEQPQEPPQEDPAAPPAEPAPDRSQAIPLDDVFSELYAWHQQQQQPSALAEEGEGGGAKEGGSSSRVSVPAYHPAMNRIADALTSAGVERVLDRRWEDQLAELRSYKAAHGTCDVPIEHAALGRWAAAQRAHYKLCERGRPSPLSDERYEKLKALGLTANRWERRLEELRAHREEHGHCDVPLEHPGLGVWVHNQRETYEFEREKMPKDRVDALDELGFNWNRWGRNRLKTREDAWDVQYKNLLAYIREHARQGARTAGKMDQEPAVRISEVSHQRAGPVEAGTRPHRQAQRDRVPVALEAPEDPLGGTVRGEFLHSACAKPPRSWRTFLTTSSACLLYPQALIQFKADHGHCRVPHSVPELGKWAKYQRDQYALFLRGKKAKINQKKIDQLTSIGFEESLDERIAVELAGDEGGAGEAAPPHPEEPPRADRRAEPPRLQRPPAQPFPTQQQLQPPEPRFAAPSVPPPPEQLLAQPQPAEPQPGQQYAPPPAEQHLQEEGIPYQQPHHYAEHAGQPYMEQYHHGAYGAPHQPQQPGPDAYHYPHGGVHYHHG
ncbi:hypothetical protein ACHAWF_007986 [Thalassiosira exigua]